MAQLGSALDWGSRGRRFKSCQPDRPKGRPESTKSTRPALRPSGLTRCREPKPTARTERTAPADPVSPRPGPAGAETRVPPDSGDGRSKQRPCSIGWDVGPGRETVRHDCVTRSPRPHHAAHPGPAVHGLTTYDAKDPDTAFPPIEPLLPPEGAPNVLVILLDDVGFGASSAVRRAVQHADRRAPRGRGVAVQPVPHHGPVRADPAGAADRPQPPFASGWAASPRPPRPRRATARCGRTPRRLWR